MLIFIFILLVTNICYLLRLDFVFNLNELYLFYVFIFSSNIVGVWCGNMVGGKRMM